MTFRPLPGEEVPAFFARIADSVQERDATVMKQDVMGPLGLRKEAARSSPCGTEAACPVTWVEGASCGEALLPGAQLWAVSGAKAEDLFEGGAPRARVLRLDEETLCLVGGMTGSPGLSPPDQTWEVLGGIKDLLSRAGMGLDCLMRTWFYLRDILDWYQAFNQVRTRFFEENRVDPRRPPASTGVGGLCPGDSALAASAMAVRKEDGSVPFEAVLSPTQCAATAYGSSFSRAVESSWGGCRRLFVSGTASIAPSGRTEHVGDVAAQIDRTLEAVAALLDLSGMSMEHVTRAVAYFSDPSDAARLSRGELIQLPLLVAHNVVCRRDLLFELELDAVQEQSLDGK